MQGLRLVYVVERIDSAFPSQVLELLATLAVNAEVQSIDLLVGVASKESVSIELRDVRVTRFRRFPNYPVANWATAFCLGKALLRLGGVQDAIFHCRGESAAYITELARRMLRMPSVKMLLDVRGAVREEILNFLGLPTMLRRIKLFGFWRQACVYHVATRVSCVSPALKRYLLDRLHVVRAEIAVVPCCAGAAFRYDHLQRLLVRQRLGVTESDLLCVFATGGDDAWQDSAKTVDSLLAIGVKVLLLSKNGSTKAGVISTYSRYEDMPGYLSAADIGVIFRGDSVVNYVASPIKVSEYLCCGLPLLANRGVQMVTEIVQLLDSGYLVEAPDKVDSRKLIALKEMGREALSREGRGRFGVDTVAKQYLEIYRSL